MRILYTRLFPFKGYKACAFFGFILVRKSAKPLSEILINHEEIHAAQARECGGWIPFYLKYLWYRVRMDYREVPFELEAYDNDHDLSYLYRRTPYNWKNYV